MAYPERYAHEVYRRKDRIQRPGKKHTKMIDTTTLSCKHEFQATSGTQ